MVFTKESKMGDILRNKTASNVLDRHFPGITRSVLAIFNRGKTLDEFSRLDPSEPWTEHVYEQILKALSHIEVHERTDMELLPNENLEDHSIPVGSAVVTAPSESQQWSVFEIELEGPEHGNPFIDVRLSAVFTNGKKRFEVL